MEKPEFEVGKWYNCSDIYWCKFKEIKSDKWWESESIHIFTKQYSNRLDWRSIENSWKEVLISEIQQYLPDGHVDKIKSFTVHDKCNVLKEVVEESKKDNMEEILLEAKRRYPIGCRFYPIHEDGTLSDKLYIQEKECYIYEDWIIGSANIRNPMGDWAKLVSSPEEKDLITIAKERYPIGTKFHPVNTITGKVNNNEKPYTVKSVPQLVESDGRKVICANGNLYYDGVWATIVSSPQEKVEYNSTDFLTPPKTESWNWSIIDMSAKPELILKDEDEPVIFPNIKRERIVEIKIKLVD